MQRTAMRHRGGTMLAGGGMTALALIAAADRAQKYVSIDWRLARAAGHRLLDGDLAVYAHVPAAQMGPLALAAAGLLDSLALYALVVCALLPITIAMMLRQNPTPPQLATAAIGGLLLVMPWGGDYAAEGHFDEILVVGGGLVMAWAYRQDRAAVMVAAFMVAIAEKPTAIAFLPIAFLLNRRAGWLALVGGGLIWAPFALADPHGFLAAGGGIVKVQPGALIELAGLASQGDPYPIWVRPVMLGLAFLAVWAATVRHGPEVAVLAALVVRPVLEPGAFPAYSTALIIAALAVDLHYRRPPLATTLAAASWFVAYWSWPLSPAEGCARLLLILAAMGIALRRPSQLADSVSAPAATVMVVAVTDAVSAPPTP